MRNELSAMFQSVLRVARSLNRDGQQGSTKRNGWMKGKKRKKSVERRGDQAKGQKKSRGSGRFLRGMRMAHGLRRRGEAVARPRKAARRSAIPNRVNEIRCA